MSFLCHYLIYLVSYKSLKQNKIASNLCRMSLVNEKIEKRELKMAKERIKIIAKECRLLEKKQ